MDLLIIAFLLTPLALKTGSLFLWGFIVLCLAAPFVSLLVGLTHRPRDWGVRSPGRLLSALHQGI